MSAEAAALMQAVFYASFFQRYPKHATTKAMRKKFRLPDHAGLIDMRTCRRTKTKVGLYRASEAGIEDDPVTPYATVCEAHSNVVCHETLAAARAAMSFPDWCEDCHPALGL